MPNTMLAIRFYRPGELKAEQVPIPNPGPGELIVKSHVALTCGTDVKMFKRGHPLAKPPQIMGHEFAGTVSEIGTGAGNFRVGMKVVSANSAPCNKCFYCLMHQPNLCERLDESMIGFTWPGSYAEYVRIPERIVRQNTFQVPDGVPLESVASLEPLACVVHGWDLVGQVPGGTAIIIGGGPIGLLHAQLARLNGARQVALCDVVPERLREAEKIGVDTTIDSANENVVERVSSLTDGRGADIVVEAVGRGETWESTIGLVRKGGAILLFGGCPSGTMVSFKAEKIHYGELHVQGAFHHTPAAVERAFRLIVSGQVSIKPLISHEMSLEKTEEALRLMGEGKALKVALRPPG
ncbi:MAG: alcohol dehydrogenase catalytic domain-containing protein [Candidatus Bathyarchaeia archaeon]|jgi:L-iditol 2-dehydrogenase